MPQSNLEQLKSAGCIPADANLTQAELDVIAGLSQGEVKTLIGIRQKLGDASGDSFTGDLTPNIVL